MVEVLVEDIAVDHLQEVDTVVVLLLVEEVTVEMVEVLVEDIAVDHLQEVDTVETHQHQEVVDMMERDQKVVIEHHDHHVVMMDDIHLLVLQDVMMDDMHHDLHVVKVEKVVIVDIVMEEDLVLIILMKAGVHMVHKDLQNSLSSLNFGKFHYFPFFYATKIVNS